MFTEKVPLIIIIIGIHYDYMYTEMFYLCNVKGNLSIMSKSLTVEVTMIQS